MKQGKEKITGRKPSVEGELESREQKTTRRKRGEHLRCTQTLGESHGGRQMKKPRKRSPTEDAAAGNTSGREERSSVVKGDKGKTEGRIGPRGEKMFSKRVGPTR